MATTRDVPATTGALLTVQDVAEACNTSTRTVRRWTATGALPVVQIGRTVRIRPDDLEAFLEAHTHRQAS